MGELLLFLRARGFGPILQRFLWNCSHSYCLGFDTMKYAVSLNDISNKVLYEINVSRSRWWWRFFYRTSLPPFQLRYLFSRISNVLFVYAWSFAAISAAVDQIARAWKFNGSQFEIFIFTGKKSLRARLIINIFRLFSSQVVSAYARTCAQMSTEQIARC